LRLFSKADPLQKAKWDKLHAQGYHPPVKEAISKVKTAAGGWLFGEWGQLLGIDINVKNKTVLEIGFGGG
jgi:hypothetical protein